MVGVWKNEKGEVENMRVKRVSGRRRGGLGENVRNWGGVHLHVGGGGGGCCGVGVVGGGAAAAGVGGVWGGAADSIPRPRARLCPSQLPVSLELM